MSTKQPARFTDEEAARKHLERLQWPDGPICPHCGTMDRASAIKGGRKGLWFCNACREQFTVTVGTVFERSKIPLNTWLYCNHLLCSSKKGISSHQLSRMLGVTYKTAWFMAHRIREAMKVTNPPPMGGFNQIVEADETFIGRKDRTIIAAGTSHKRAVVSLVQRDGKARSFHVEKVNKKTVEKHIYENIDPKSTIMSDDARHYTHLEGFAAVHSVNHSKGEYVRGIAHSNTVEGFFSIFKRGMIGTYQHCSEAHLQRYLHEFDFRYSNRIALGCDDAVRADRALQGIVGKRLTYRRISTA